MKFFEQLVSYVKKHKFIVLLLLISIITHWQWFILGRQFAGGDSVIYPESAFPNYSLGNGTWFSFEETGWSNVQPYQLGFFQIWRLLSLCHVSSAVCEQLTMLIPIAILSLFAPFVLIKKLFNSDYSGFIGAIIFGFSTTFIVYQATEIFMCLAFSILPIVIFLFIKFLEKQTWDSVAVFVLIFSLQCMIEIRIAFLTLIIILFYFILRLIYIDEKLLSIKKVVGGIIAFLVINFFWIATIIFSGYGTLTSIQQRSTFGDAWTDLSHAVTLHSPMWINGTINAFGSSSIPTYSWLLPLLIIFAIFTPFTSAGSSSKLLKTF